MGKMNVAQFAGELGLPVELLLEQLNGDFARTMARQFLYSAFADLYWRAMMKSDDSTLAAIAA